MTRSIAALLLLAACGAPCVACGGDDGGDAPPARVSFTATWESSTDGAQCLAASEITLVVDGFDTDTPVIGTQPCGAAVLSDGFWAVACPAPTDAMLAIGVRLSVERDTGSVTASSARNTNPSCVDTYRMTLITVE